MDETQLRTLMIKNPVTRRHFRGVIASDDLALVKPMPETFYIVNTDKSTGVGEHWTVMYIDKHSEFFDSLGQPPATYDKEFRNFLVVSGPKYMFNTKRLQSFMSPLCGEFCVYFCHYRCLGYSFVDIVDMFGDNLKLNDVKVELFVNNLIQDLFN